MLEPAIMKEAPGIIERVNLGTEDHGINTLMINIRFDSFCQGFGGNALGQPGSWVEKSIINDILEVMGVTDIQQLKGQPVIALYKNSFWTERITGIKSPVTGKTFSLQDWQNKIEVLNRIGGTDGRK